MLGAPAGGGRPPAKAGLGVCIHSYMIRSRAAGMPRFSGDPVAFLEHCHTLGAGGIQVGLGRRDEAYATRLRRRAEEYGVFIEGIAGMPRNRHDVDRFAAELHTAKSAGATVIRVVLMPGRRYEQYASAGQFHEALQRGRRALELAEPVAARYRLRLALENHKDQRIAERIALIQGMSSEYAGMCVDTGNSIALLEEPMAVVEAYAPWAFSVHLKDMAVREYADGFLLSEVPFGEGFLDLARMVRLLKTAHPEARFSLEMITRDPLRVPCLTEKYWATFKDVPARDLAGTLALVRANASAEPLPRVSHLSQNEQIKREEENVRSCLAFARDPLSL